MSNPDKSGKSNSSQPLRQGHEGSRRESLESFIVAFIIAYVVKSFAFEAFVIPTGSMAPTLMGQHKDYNCPQCGFLYAVSASDGHGASQIAYGTCVNCRYTTEILENPVYSGDRILVLKTLFDIPARFGGGPPRRWDVTVFKYPEEPETNYIKRLVGLPGEELRIERGDIYTRRLNSTEPFKIERKPLDHQQAMQILVNDDAHRPALLKDDKRWSHWRSDEGGWAVMEDGLYEATSSGGNWLDMRYEHRVPTPDQWRDIATSRPLKVQPRSSLITDYYSYNTYLTRDSYDKQSWFQPHWVGDLSVEMLLQVDKPSGEFRIELVEAGVANQFVVDLATGMGRMMRGGKQLAETKTPIREGGRFKLRFANVDNRLTLWINHLTPFGAGVEYEPDAAENKGPQAADLKPVGVAVKDGKVSVSRLRLTRDIYYSITPGGFDYGENLWSAAIVDSSAFFNLISDPLKFVSFNETRHNDYPIADGRYMMMGDNSPLSKDSRAWTTTDRFDEASQSGWDDTNRQSWEVPERLIVGKAFMVYWPHAWSLGKWSFQINFRGRKIDFPFWPNFERMKVIR